MTIYRYVKERTEVVGVLMSMYFKRPHEMEVMFMPVLNFSRRNWVYYLHLTTVC
jgi:hypothetical protein